MKLLDKAEYDYIENILRGNNSRPEIDESIKEVLEWFEKEKDYRDFYDMFYSRRGEYKNRYPSNSDMLYFLKKKLCCETTRIYQMRKDIVYKTAMVLYKNGLLCTEANENENRDD